jgi:hypothetical protein
MNQYLGFIKAVNFKSTFFNNKLQKELKGKNINKYDI